MFFPWMAGLLAIAAFVAAGIFAATRTRRLALILTFVGLGMTVLAVGLAASAELHLRSCESRNQKRSDAWRAAHPGAIGAPLGAISYEACERWPW